MPQNTIAQIKEILQAPGQLSYVENQTLGGLLDRLQTELLSLPQDQQAQAHQIAKLTKEKVQMMNSLKKYAFHTLILFQLIVMIQLMTKIYHQLVKNIEGLILL